MHVLLVVDGCGWHVVRVAVAADEVEWGGGVGEEVLGGEVAGEGGAEFVAECGVGGGVVAGAWFVGGDGEA